MEKTIAAYSDEINKMTSKANYYAKCKSSNELTFDFPYNGGSVFFLNVRNIGNGNEIILNTDKGQFLLNYNNTDLVKVRFDDNQPVNFSYSNANDGSANIIFINNSAKFLQSLKKAKRVYIQASFYSAGSHILEFNTDSLVWDH